MSINQSRGVRAQNYSVNVYEVIIIVFPTGMKKPIK